MTEQSRTIAATVVGGIIGALAGYMFFTKGGRALRRRLEPTLDDLARELMHFRGTLSKAVNVAGEGWKVLTDALGEVESREGRYVASPRQSAPF